MKLTYRLCGDYYLPNSGIPAEDMRPLGKYGRMRMRYLREHRSLLFNQLLLSGKLMKHLYSIDDACQQYKQLQSQANADSDEIQHNAVTAASSRLQQAYGKRFDAQLLRDSQKEISRLADPHEADSSVREQLRLASLRAEKEATHKHHSRETTPPAR